MYTGFWSESERNILVEVFPSETDAQVSALFREINAAEPVRLVDMVAHEAVADVATDADVNTGGTPVDEEVAAATSSPGDRTDVSLGEPAGATATPTPSQPADPMDPMEILTTAADLLAQEHADMFKASSRCKPPHLNVDVLRDDLFQSGFLARHDVVSVAQLLALLSRVNASVKAQHSAASASAPPSKAMQTARKKATEHDFYLGVDKAWLYQTYSKDT